jgi:hypothetical protein
MGISTFTSKEFVIFCVSIRLAMMIEKPLFKHGIPAGWFSSLVNGYIIMERSTHFIAGKPHYFNWAIFNNYGTSPFLMGKLHYFYGHFQ